MGASPSRLRRLALALAAVATGVAIGAAFHLLDLPAGPRVGGSFSLVDHDGRRVTEANYRGRALAVFFGFTHCPDVCPAALARMAEMLDALGPDAERLQPLFVTVDPARDTPAALRDYVAHFSPRIVGLSGSDAEIAAMAKAWRAYYRAQGPARGGQDYLVDHSAFVYVMDAQGRFVGTFGPDASLEAALRLVRRAL
ncbi:MAG: SCO family protein [Alphaproteobacteria bacterium]|nr:SCO family protein [Alphaproteobacteria bacterium]